MELSAVLLGSGIAGLADEQKILLQKRPAFGGNIMVTIKLQSTDHKWLP